jgi:hypothetical protein
MELDKESLSASSSSIVHELAQSLLIIHAYVRGCIERIKNNSLDIERLKELLIKVNQQVQIMSKNIYYLSALNE